jgi:hypothetical protein
MRIHPASDPVAEAQALAQGGRYREAIAMLSEHNRRQPTPQWERWLVEWRYLVYQAEPPQPRTTPPTAWDRMAPTLSKGASGVPEIGADQLNGQTLAAGILGHGALLVRGLVGAGAVAEMIDGIERAFEACSRWRTDGAPAEPSPWYSHVPVPDDNVMIQAGRPFVEEAGGVWTADSPRMLFQFLEVVQQTRVLDAITEYLGERPLLSVGKSTLRKVSADLAMPGDWHQDGAFLGESIRSVNLWLCLSDCGVEASGLDFVPRRVQRLLPTATHGSYFSWSIGHGLVVEEAGADGYCSPIFRPGDAMLFDHYFVHRTSRPEAIAHPRYAIESWFFAPSAYPADNVPLLV